MILKKQLLGNLLAPLRVRDFRLLFAGQMISTMGDMFYAVALPWLMLSSGHTPQELGIVLATYGVPRVGTLLLGGLLSDWLRPRRVMLLADSMRALLVGVLVVLVLTGRTAVLPLCAVAALLGAFAGLFLPAYYSAIFSSMGCSRWRCRRWLAINSCRERAAMACCWLCSVQGAWARSPIAAC